MFCVLRNMCSFCKTSETVVGMMRISRWISVLRWTLTTYSLFIIAAALNGLFFFTGNIFYLEYSPMYSLSGARYARYTH